MSLPRHLLLPTMMTRHRPHTKRPQKTGHSFVHSTTFHKDSDLNWSSFPQDRRLHKERSKLFTLIDNYSLKLSAMILSKCIDDDDDPSEFSIQDRIDAIKEESRVLNDRGFKVPKGRIGGEMVVDEKLIREIDDCPKARRSLDERIRVYRREAERQERRLWQNFDKLERMDDKRFLMKQVRILKGDLLSYSAEPEDSFSSILSSDLARELVAATSKVNKLFGLRFGQPLVVDMGLPYKMRGQEVESFYKQMKELYLTNQTLHEPYDIHICNWDADDDVAVGLLSSLGDEYIWTVSRKCFTEIFPKQRLVYMTPDSPHVMTEFRHDDVFVLGACVDVLDPDSAKGISYEKVKRLGLRSARLDLDSYFNMRGFGTRRGRNSDRPDTFPLLAASDVFSVITDARESLGDWDLAHRTLFNGRKRVLKWKTEKNDFLNKISDFRFQQIVDNVKIS